MSVGWLSSTSHRGDMAKIEVPHGAVVVGVDGSPASDRAVIWGARQAALEGRPIALVHGASATVATTWMGAPAFNPATVLQAIEDSGKAQLEAASAVVHEREPGVEVYRVYDHHDPRDALLGFTANAAMVVVGSRGRGPMASLLLGSVSLAVSQHASCPVIVVRHDAEEDHGVEAVAEIGRVDEVADQVGGQRGAAGNDRHQDEGEGVLRPADKPLLEQQPADHGGGAITRVG